jgi:hypothetical protein
MKVKVLRRFKDKYTKQVYDKGRIIEVTNERYEEINSTAHGILVEPIPVDLENMTKAELLEYAEAKGIEGLNNRMTKAEIIAALEG